LVAAGALWAPPQKASAEDDHPPSKAVAGLDVAPGLEATLFASEPMVLSPSNIDVDHLGRVWVCEVVNYRHRDGSRPQGDRILILEDTNGDGRADKSTVFHQGRDIDTALGICVLGNRVIVSVSPNVFVFTDSDGDGKADKKEVLFSKTGRSQHDHTAHAFVFGPDGRLYWNFGNEGHSVHDRNGHPVIDIFGRPVNDQGKPYRDGMAFRCDLDGKRFEVLGHNFRNNYELAVDSFGGVWQSDNDDDGNRGARINFLLEYGNYGYRDEMTGAGWQTPRTNLEADVPHRHWHQNDPGVVPNLLVTGAGSPTGILVYEGDLLPPVFRGQVIHCDAGPNVVRSYPVENDGAGYRARIVNVLRGARDNWFRPSDVCVAPDGSLFVADWYDPGVGGHHMGDIKRGRIFRIAPPKTPYRISPVDLSTIEGAIAALQSPNLAARYLGWSSLAARKTEAEPALAAMYKRSANPRLRARALWLLANIPSAGADYVRLAAKDRDPHIRMTALRAARQLSRPLLETVRTLVHDPSPQVRRECALALRNLSGPERADLWGELARQYDGHDRWYLESLGIGAEGNWDDCLTAMFSHLGAAVYSFTADIIWRSRGSQSARLLVSIIDDPGATNAALPRYMRAFDFLSGSEKQHWLSELAFNCQRGNQAGRQYVMAEAMGRLDREAIVGNPQHFAALKRLVEASRSTPDFLSLIERFKLPGYGPDLLAFAQANAENERGVRAIRVLLSQNQGGLIQAALTGADLKKSETTVQALSSSEEPAAVPVVLSVMDDEKRPVELRRELARAIARTRPGARLLLRRADAGKLDVRLKEAVAAALHASRSDEIRGRAMKLFPLPPAAGAQPLPPIKQLARRNGNAERGLVVFATVGTCAKCHLVKGEGKDVGPNLTEIGSKLSRPALYESILFPSAGINHNFATYTLLLQNGNIVSGVLTSRTADRISIKGIDAIVRSYPMSEVEEVKEEAVSLMPADLQKAMTAANLVDLVEYLTTLKVGIAKSAAGLDNNRANALRSSP
jgi:putative membrane-bound dehydrogenase-like protein